MTLPLADPDDVDTIVCNPWETRVLDASLRNEPANCAECGRKVSTSLATRRHIARTRRTVRLVCVVCMAGKLPDEPPAALPETLAEVAHVMAKKRGAPWN